MKNLNMNNQNLYQKKNVEKNMSQNKGYIKIIENEYNEKRKPKSHRNYFSSKINYDINFLQNQNLKYENELNSIKSENIKLKKILYEKEKIISSFQNVIEEAKEKMELLLLDNKKIMNENKKLKEELIKFKTGNKSNENKNLLNEVQNLRNELFNIEKYNPQKSEKNSFIYSFDKGKKDSKDNLKQSISSRTFYNNNIINLNDEYSNRVLNKYNSHRNLNSNKSLNKSNKREDNLISFEFNNSNNNNILKENKDIFINTLYKKNNHGRNRPKNYESLNPITSGYFIYKNNVNNYINKLNTQFENPIKIIDKTYDVNNINY